MPVGPKYRYCMVFACMSNVEQLKDMDKKVLNDRFLKFLTNIRNKINYQTSLISYMVFQRSKSCVQKQKIHKAQKNAVSTPSRRLSMKELGNRRSQQSGCLNVNKQKILKYIQKRSDVEIIKFYSEYKEQFFRKSISLQNLLYESPYVRQKYLSEDNAHFLRGLQQIMLNLFRKKVIVQGSFVNMRQQAVEQIQKWVFSWIQRQILCQKTKHEQQTAITQTIQLLGQIRQFSCETHREKQYF